MIKVAVALLSLFSLVTGMLLIELLFRLPPFVSYYLYLLLAEYMESSLFIKVLKPSLVWTALDLRVKWPFNAVYQKR